jgi:hypothetical protein
MGVSAMAAKRADLMLERGDDDGRLLWTRIRRAIDALQAPPFRFGESQVKAAPVLLKLEPCC